jgi:hypothetical protein
VKHPIRERYEQEKLMSDDDDDKDPHIEPGDLWMKGDQP